MTLAKIIDVDVEKTNAGLLRATSRQMSELHVAGETLDDIRLSVPAVIEATMEARGTPARAFEAERNGDRATIPWVVIPREDFAAAD